MQEKVELTFRWQNVSVLSKLWYFGVFFLSRQTIKRNPAFERAQCVCMDEGQPDSTTATEKLLRGTESWDRWKYDWGLSDKSCKLEVLTCGNMFPTAMQFWISPEVLWASMEEKHSAAFSKLKSITARRLLSVLRYSGQLLEGPRLSFENIADK